MKTIPRLALAIGASLLTGAAFAAPAPPRGGGSHGGASHGGGFSGRTVQAPQSRGGWHAGGTPPGGSHFRSFHGGWHGGGWHGGWNGRRFHGGFYRPWGWGWGAGWGWGWGWYGYPGWWGGYYGGAPYGSVTYAPGAWAVVDTDVSPDEALVYLDGRYIGSADDFDGYPDYLYLKPGRYKLEFRLEGFETYSVDVDARPGVKLDIDRKLKKIPGAKQYGSYNPPVPEGGVRRFWGKEKNAATAIDVDADEGAYSDWPDRDRDRDRRPPAGAREEAPEADRPPTAAPDATEYSEPPPERSAAAPVPAGRGRIVFRIEPGDAAVYVDDRFAGTGEELSSLSRGLQVAAGPHKVVVSRPGFGTEAIQVDVASGKAETVEVALDRP